MVVSLIWTVFGKVRLDSVLGPDNADTKAHEGLLLLNNDLLNNDINSTLNHVYQNTRFTVGHYNPIVNVVWTKLLDGDDYPNFKL